MSRLKTSSSKSAKTSSTSGYDKTKRRKKKSTPRRSASSSAVSSSPASPPLAPSSPLSISAPSGMRNSISSSSGSPSAGTPTSSRECEQCGNPAQLEVGANAKAVANSKKVAQSGCHVCDFVAYRKSLRHCMVCDKTQCDVFCDWCGHGFHMKCAKTRGEHIDSAGFCCKKCEAEQADDASDDDDDDEANDINAKCGECHKPFNSTAIETATAPSSSAKKHADKKANEPNADATGFKVNQSVLVENDEVLYNAVITDVDAKNERVKIHFLRWSKSFDNWYTMDDERINESLACDCCNRWFHIGCLPPIKSSGRFKDTTYVCPSCLDDARGFYNGTRTTVTSTKSSKPAIANGFATATASSASSSSSGRRKAAASNDDHAAISSSSSKKRSSKLIVQSESEEEADEDDSPEPVRSKSTKKSSDKENVRDENTTTTSSKSKKRRRANSVDSVGSSGSEKRAKAAVAASASSPAKKSESEANGRRSQKSKRRDRSSSHDEDEETKDNGSPKKPKDGDGDAKPHKTKTVESASKEGDVSVDASAAEAAVEASNASSTGAVASSDIDASTKVPPGNMSQATASGDGEMLTMDKPSMKRKVSGHSVSSLLNSPSSPPRESPVLRSAAASSAAASSSVKVEKDPLALASSSAKKTSAPTRSKVWVTGRDAKSAKAAAAAASATTMTTATTTRGALSAFDILREVASQSMSDEIDPPATALPPTTASRRSQKPRMTAAERKQAMVKNEGDKTTMNHAGGSGMNGRTPMMPSSSASAVGIPMNSYVDLHFGIRKEMYLRICLLEDERLLERETAQLLRAMIYPTSDKFHDLKFVYVVNKDLSSLQLTKRLLELVPITSGGTAPVIAPVRPALSGPMPQPPPGATLGGSANSSAAPSPARPAHGSASAYASPAPKGYTTPARTVSPAIENVTSSNTSLSNHHQPEREPQPTTQPATHKLFQLPTSIGYASAVERTRPVGPSSAPAASATSSILTSVISPSSVIGPPMAPPPLSTKLLLETMHKHSKFPTLLPPPPSSLGSSSSASAVVTSTTSSSSSSSSSSSASASAVVAPTTSSAPSASVPPAPSSAISAAPSSSSSAPSSSSVTTTVAASTTLSASIALAPPKPSLDASSPSPASTPPASLVNNTISASTSISSN